MAEHIGDSPQDCPACVEANKQIAHLRDAKVRKVYGKVSRNARREHSANQRDARTMADQTWKAHFNDRRTPKKPQGGEPGLTSL